MRPGSAAIVSVVSEDALNRRPQMTRPIDESCARAQYLAIENDPGCGARGPSPKRRRFGCAPPATLPLALRPAPIVYDAHHLLEGRSPASLSPIRRGIVQWHAHSRCD